MRIVAVNWRDLTHPLAGGAEVMVDRLLDGLAARGHDVALVCGGPVAQHPYEVINAGGTYSQYLRAPVACLTRFRDADVVIDAENGLPYFSPLWRRRPSVCLVFHLHTDQWRTRFPVPVAGACSWLERAIMPLVYRNRPFVAISRSTSESLQAVGVPPDHITVIESGVDIPTVPVPEKSDQPLFVSLNRIVPHKRIDLLVKAWEIAGPEIGGKLVIAGDGPALGAVRRLAAAVPNVEVAGRVSEEVKLDLLGRSWALLSAAHHEGWGMSVTEAATFGTPALAVDAPGIRDAVLDGVTGLLVRETDGSAIPRALAAAMILFAKDPEQRWALGSSARLRVEEFTWDRFVDRWEVLLRRVADGGIDSVTP